jgi:pyruvate dehydrogenase (quinone)
MANALPQAIGAQTAFPGRQVITFSGDGGLAMLMGELLTLVQYQLPVKIILFDNRRLGMVSLEQEVAGYKSSFLFGPPPTNTRAKSTGRDLLPK